MECIIGVYPNTLSLAGNALSNQSVGSWAIRKAKAEEAPNLYMLSLRALEEPTRPEGFKTKDDLVNFLIKNQNIFKPEKVISCLPSIAAETITVTYPLSENEKINKVVEFLKEYSGYQWDIELNAGYQNRTIAQANPNYYLRVCIINPISTTLYRLDPKLLNPEAAKEIEEQEEKEKQLIEPHRQAIEKVKEICELANVKLQQNTPKLGAFLYNYFNLESTLSIYNQLDLIKEKLSVSSNSNPNPS